MPTDPYAVLQALLRAEAARSRRTPAAEHRSEPAPAPITESPSPSPRRERPAR
ncbi:hypothetical protein HHL19_15340 [Streptomyces sp. R302]|uniref:hypothetical protein n=1 Tax=unclassified Streptomyces TaxID=2593676 RepID=UPI00145C6398|nr:MULTISPECIES: hypothetical protein [unclassified Streptomyces]NML51446.1 hypothetical protein [Streptomyces sp. R301]NML80024.1 hypothetical protein [Streptomyces sp. R302]